MIWKFAWHSNTTYSKHVALEFLVAHVLVGVHPRGRCATVTPVPQITKLPKNSQNNEFKVCDLIWVSILPAFWMGGNNWSFGDDLSGGSIRIPTQLDFSIVAPEDHYRRSYYDLLHKKTSTFEISVMSSHLQFSNIRTAGFAKKYFRSCANVTEIEITFSGQIWGKLVMGS